MQGLAWILDFPALDAQRGDIHCEADLDSGQDLLSRQLTFDARINLTPSRAVTVYPTPSCAATFALP